jgi:hypothetical protein
LPSTRVAATLRGRAMRAKVALTASAIALAGLGCLAACLVASGAPVTAADVTTANEPPTTVTQATTQSTSVTQTSATTVITPGPGQPSVILPDKKRTPGALNPKVRQSTIKKTICKSGWTARIRPPVSYTNALKIKQMVLYEETGSPSEYEEDHFIPLELGGAPRNPKNLWPEPRSQATLSDPLETSLKRKVCEHVMTLKKARATIRLFKNTQG